MTKITAKGELVLQLLDLLQLWGIVWLEFSSSNIYAGEV